MTKIHYTLYVMRSTLILTVLFFISGCGYTTGSLLPEHIKNIHVKNFTNKIPLTQESTDRNAYKTYRPLLEVDVTQSIIDKFIFDGNLRVTRAEDANIILEGSLVDFRREVTKYGDDDNIDQYRIAIMVDMELTDVATGKTSWVQKSFSGSDYYFTTGAQAKSEDTAITDALSDLARRVVERTIEAW